MLLTLALALHLNLSKCFSELVMQRAIFSLEVLHRIPSDANSFTRNKATVHDMNGGTTEEKVSTLKWLLFAYLLPL